MENMSAIKHVHYREVPLYDQGSSSKNLLELPWHDKTQKDSRIKFPLHILRSCVFW